LQNELLPIAARLKVASNISKEITAQNILHTHPDIHYIRQEECALRLPLSYTFNTENPVVTSASGTKYIVYSFRPKRSAKANSQEVSRVKENIRVVTIQSGVDSNLPCRCGEGLD
jgi:hypothetical protein